MHTSRCVAVWGVLRLAVTRGSASAVLPLLAAQPTSRLAAVWSAAPAGTRTDGPRGGPAILHPANISQFSKHQADSSQFGEQGPGA